MPWLVLEATLVRPSMPMTASSIMSTTSISMTSGRRIVQPQGDVDDRKVNVRHLADPHPLKRDRPEDDEPEHEHPGENGASDGDLGQAHGA